MFAAMKQLLRDSGIILLADEGAYLRMKREIHSPLSDATAFFTPDMTQAQCKGSLNMVVQGVLHEKHTHCLVEESKESDNTVVVRVRACGASFNKIPDF
jgi:hypothetical protein